MIPQLELALRLLIAALCGAVIGLEREYHNQPAGLRTHIILSMGAALAMGLSIQMATAFAPNFNGDPARIAAQVVTGVGFLGAGAILRYGLSVRGLTTAASLWTMAIIGMIIGAGYYLVGGIATVLVLGSLSAVELVEERFFGNSTIAEFTVAIEDKQGAVEELQQELTKIHVKARIIKVSRDLRNESITVRFNLMTRRGWDTASMTTVLRDYPGLISYSINM